MTHTRKHRMTRGRKRRGGAVSVPDESTVEAVKRFIADMSQPVGPLIATHTTDAADCDSYAIQKGQERSLIKTCYLNPDLNVINISPSIGTARQVITVRKDGMEDGLLFIYPQVDDSGVALRTIGAIRDVLDFHSEIKLKKTGVLGLLSKRASSMPADDAKNISAALITKGWYHDKHGDIKALITKLNEALKTVDGAKATAPGSEAVGGRPKKTRRHHRRR